jgi:hypothetical protein
MGDVIGLVPVPGDKPLGEFIQELINRDTEFLNEKLGELLSTIKETREEGQPTNFAYAKMQNYLNKVATYPEIISLAAAGLWHQIVENGQDYDLG